MIRRKYLARLVCLYRAARQSLVPLLLNDLGCQLLNCEPLRPSSFLKPLAKLDLLRIWLGLWHSRLCRWRRPELWLTVRPLLIALLLVGVARHDLLNACPGLFAPSWRYGSWSQCASETVPYTLLCMELYPALAFLAGILRANYEEIAI